MINRITSGPGIFLQPGFLSDVLVFSEETNEVEYFKDVRTDYIFDSDFSKNSHFYTVSLEYGHIEGDPFSINRDPNPVKANEASYLHPIIRRYQHDHLVVEHHIPDDLENAWFKDEYVTPALDFFKAQMKS